MSFFNYNFCKKFKFNEESLACDVIIVAMLFCLLPDSSSYSCTAVINHTQFSNDDNNVIANPVQCQCGQCCSIGYDHITKTRGHFDTLHFRTVFRYNLLQTQMVVGNLQIVFTCRFLVGLMVHIGVNGTFKWYHFPI